MTELHHVIRRHTIELRLTRPGAERRTAQRVTALAPDLTAAIERSLGTLALGERVVRIGRLELDLGRVSLAQLEASLPAALEAALRPAVVRAAGLGDERADAHPDGTDPSERGTAPATQDRPEQSAGVADPGTPPGPLELIAGFALDGTLPWWQPAIAQDVPEEVVLATAARAAARETPAALARLLRGWPETAAPWRRLLLQFDTTTLQSLGQALAPDLDQPAHAALWAQATALVEGRRAGGPAERARAAASAVLGVLRGAPGTVAEATASLRRRLAPDEVAPTGERATANEPVLHLVQAAIERHAGPADPLASVTMRLARLDSAARTRVAEAAQRLLSLAAGSAAAREGLAELRAALAQDDVVPAVAASPARARSGALPSLPVPNAGLPILWPFLAGFVDRLGLTDPAGAPRDVAAQHRAAALFDHLATGADWPAEARLALPKLLAGLPVDTVHEPGEAFTATEREEATLLLGSVLENAQPLGTLTIDGFRGSFLIRPGLLSMRDGAFLLQVERRGYDLLLDRLAWRWEWVRTPWMAGPMRVEW